MSRWIVDYEDKSGDLSHVWVEASSKSEAEDYVRSEYWDIAEIIDIYKQR